jgi:hypothetical protein
MEQENAAPAALPAGIEDFQELGTNEQIAALYKALAQAKRKFGKVVKSQTSGKGSVKEYKYADLQDSLDATVEHLGEFGLAMTQPLTYMSGVAIVRTTLSHQDGARIRALFAVPLPESGDVKEFGANTTYSRRYAYNAMLALAADQDADQTGVGHPEPTNMRRREPEAPPPKAQGSGSGPATTARQATSSAGAGTAGSRTQAASGGGAPQGERPLAVGEASRQPSEASRTTSPTSNTNTTAQGSTSSPRSSEATSPSPLAPTPPPEPTSRAGSTPPPAPTTAPTGNGSQPASSAAELTPAERSVVSRLCQQAGAQNAIQIRALVDKVLDGKDVKLGRANYRACIIGLLSHSWTARAGITAEQIGVHIGPEVTPDAVSACLADLETAAAARAAQGG